MISDFPLSFKDVISARFNRFPEALTSSSSLEITRFMIWYNGHKYQQTIENVMSDDMYDGRREDILARRVQRKRKNLLERKQCNATITNGVEIGS